MKAKMYEKINESEAVFVLNNLDVFIERFERKTNKKITSEVRKIIEELLLEKARPEILN